MRLTEIMGATHRALRRGGWRYLASLDTAGAFGNVSHLQLKEAMKDFGVDGHNRRILHNWPRAWGFRVEMATPTGFCFSGHHPITKGLTQGGAIPPCLSMAFFNTVIEGVNRRRANDDLGSIEYTDVVFEDDITFLITVETRRELQRAARMNAGFPRVILKEMSLQVATHKCQNIDLSSLLLPSGIFRRPDTVSNNAKQRLNF